MNHRILKVTATFLFIAAAFCLGFFLGTRGKTEASRNVPFQESGIAEALSSDQPYQAAAAERDVVLHGGSGGHGKGLYCVDANREFSLRCAEDARRGFVLALRREIERILVARGATLTGSGSDDYRARRLGYAYKWGANVGMIHGFLVDDAKESRLIMLVYEHRR